MPQHARFGNLVGQHTGRFGAGGWLWYIGAILTAAGLMNLGQGWAAMVSGAEGDGGEKVVLGILALLIGAAVLLTAMMRWRQSVAIYERGLVHTKLLGMVEVAFADVADIELVRTYSRSGSSEDLHVKLRSGDEVTIGSVTDIEQLASMIRSAPR